MSSFLEYLLDLVTALIVLRMLYSAVRQLFRGSASRRTTPAGVGGGKSAPVKGEMARDPVCGMFVSTELSRRLKQDGKTLHFCSQECLETYEKQKAVSRNA